MNAQVAACRTGEARFQAILDRFGYETYVAARRRSTASRRSSSGRRSRAIPDGTYDAEGSLDDDGLGHGPVPVNMRIDVEGDQMTIDLDGSAPQTEGAGQLRPRPDDLGLPASPSSC